MSEAVNAGWMPAIPSGEGPDAPRGYLSARVA